jgi:hypothetical protein
VDLAVEAWDDKDKQVELGEVFIKFLDRVSQAAPQAR